MSAHVVGMTDLGVHLASHYSISSDARLFRCFVCRVHLKAATHGQPLLVMASCASSTELTICQKAGLRVSTRITPVTTLRCAAMLLLPDGLDLHRQLLPLMVAIWFFGADNHLACLHTSLNLDSLNS